MPMEQMQYQLPVGEEGDTDVTVIDIDGATNTTEDVLDIPEVEGETTTAETVVTLPDDDDEDIEVEVVDDTPDADKNRVKSDAPAELTDEEMAQYNKKAEKRIKHFSKGYHDERREKEEAQRKGVELNAFAQKLLKENEALKGSVSKGHESLLQQAKKSVEIELAVASEAYRKAYESGNPDAVVAAQSEFTAATIKADKIRSFKLPAAQTPLQDNPAPVQREVTAAPTVQRDERAEEWAADNTWFGTNTQMTSLALGLHNELINEKRIDPKSDEYYDKINSRMRELFPGEFESSETEVVVNPKAPNVVAPVARSTVPKKYVLTRSQAAIARDLGITNKQYAKQAAIEALKAKD